LTTILGLKFRMVTLSVSLVFRSANEASETSIKVLNSAFDLKCKDSSGKNTKSKLSLSRNSLIHLETLELTP